jgi:DNA polymerase I-like protein with 3'-5' exonuclease and polymerase domains
MNLFPDLSAAKMLSLDIETYDPDLKENGPGVRRNGYILGVAIGTDDGFKHYYPVAHPTGNYNKAEVYYWLKEQLSRPKQIKIGANLLYDLDYLANVGVPVAGLCYDVQNAEPLIDENAQGHYNLDDLGLKYVGIGKEYTRIAELCDRAGFKGSPVGHLWQLPADDVRSYVEQDITLPIQIFEKQKAILKEERLWDLFLLETRLVPMLLRMRRTGVRIDESKLETTILATRAKLREANEHIRSAFGLSVDIWAAASIAKAFDKLGVQYPRTLKKQAPSFTKAFLESCEHPLAKMVVEARSLDKFLHTFLEGSIRDQIINGRIHCQFNQQKSDDYGTVTGRMSACLPGYVQVPTLHAGTLRMDVLQVGDLVWTHNRRWRPVTRKIDNGIQPIYHIELENGHSIDCTSNHRILTERGFLSLEDMYEYMPAGPAKQRIIRKRRERVPFRGGTNNKGYIKKVFCNSTYYSSNIETGHISLYTQRAKAVTLCSGQGRKTESYVWKISRTSPQLQRGYTRRKRIFNNTPSAVVQRMWNKKARTSSPSGYVSSAGVEQHTQGHGCTSYRWGHNQQLNRKLGVGIGCWSQSHSSTRYAQIKTVSYVGDARVYDVEVKQDHCFLADGIFVHNSNPNLQQMPSRDPVLGPLCRSMFIPEEEHTWTRKDYSQIEIRVLAHYARGTGSDAVRQAFVDKPDLDYHQWCADLAGISRKSAKTINFGLVYGMGATKLGDKLGLDADATKHFLSLFHEHLPFAKETLQEASRVAQGRGYVRTILGRRRRFDSWEPRDWDLARKLGVTRDKDLLLSQIDKEIHLATINMWHAPTPGIRRAGTHKALNAVIQGTAAEVMKKAMVDAYEAGVFDVLVPHLTVHDELDQSEPDSVAGREADAELTSIMENTIKFHVPILVESERGPSWGELK